MDPQPACVVLSRFITSLSENSPIATLQKTARYRAGSCACNNYSPFDDKVHYPLPHHNLFYCPFPTEATLRITTSTNSVADENVQSRDESSDHRLNMRKYPFISKHLLTNQFSNLKSKPLDVLAEKQFDVGVTEIGCAQPARSLYLILSLCLGLGGVIYFVCNVRYVGNCVRAFCDEVSVEQRWNEGTGETGDPLENLPTSGVVRHDSHMRKSGSEPGSPRWEANLICTVRRYDGNTARFGRRSDEAARSACNFAWCKPFYLCSPFTVTSNFVEALLKFCFQDIPPPPEFEVSRRPICKADSCLFMNCIIASTRKAIQLGGAARPRSRSEEAIRATLTRTPSASSLLRASRVQCFRRDAVLCKLDRNTEVLLHSMNHHRLNDARMRNQWRMSLSFVTPSRLLTVTGAGVKVIQIEIGGWLSPQHACLSVLAPVPAYLGLFSVLQAVQRWGDKDDNATRIKCAIVAKRNALNWRTHHDRNTARLARRSDEALGLCVSVARIVPSLLDLGRAAVAERLAFSPPTKVNRVQSLAGSLPDFRMWESYRTMSLTGGFSRGSPVSLAFSHSGTTPYSPCSILIGYQHLNVKSGPNLPLTQSLTHFTNMSLVAANMTEECRNSELRLQMMQEMRAQNFDMIRFASYRTACKLRFVQKKVNRENDAHNSFV
ncbi:hypothetical protein PR048_029653 [Dryococelus australis]|uniref:EF-hand domain-containing protein n=1 Tax=Dryococelus australis TaxID=614101 RepID=A0ABQ9GE03_9NEOP|nr:hypothetical protein PR048_029653 [Dryococelus australis]